jgi:hypothetical protein
VKLSPVAENLGRARLDLALDAWAERAVLAARLGDTYLPGQTNLALKPVRALVLIRKDRQ